MTRSDKNKPSWKKITPGVLYPFPNQRGRRIKPQEQIRASQEEIAHVADHFELVENGKGEYKVKKEKKEIIETPEAEEYDIKSVGKGWYDVISPEGKLMNEKKLRADDAKELKASLEEETDTE